MNSGISILNVENGTDDYSLLVKAFEERGCQIINSRTAKDALKQVLIKRLGAIILDLNIPEVNGIELCRIIRTFDIRTPIIFYSAEQNPIFIKAAVNSGANNYLIKPKDFFVLIETVINNYESQITNYKLDTTSSSQFAFRNL